MTTTAAIRRLIAFRGLRGRRDPSAPAGPRRVRTAIAVALVVACGVVGAVEILPALAGPSQANAKPVPRENLATIVAAATSCPALTPARLAASLMAASGFDSTIVEANGAMGIAALTTDDWKKWRPWSDASRRDDRANIFALAHRTCDFVGQLRAAKVPGDPWQAAMAVDGVGLPAVLKAHRVPADAQHHVDLVSGYAEWYASQPQLSRSTVTPAPVTLDSSGDPTDVMPVPDAYVPDVLAAGRTCATITPARVAAQLMAASRFNPNRTGPDGLQGIAQFRPEAWNRYGPSGSTSPWNPRDAIPALGTAMCDLVRQLSGLNSGDPYILALAAFQWGTDTVRATAGVPRLADMQQLSDRATRYVRYYSEDRQLNDTPAAPPGPSATTPGPARPAAPKASAAAAPAAPAAPPAPPPPAGRALVSRASGKCLSATAGGDGTPLVLWTCNASVAQQWQAYPDGTIRAVGLCMDSPWGSTANSTGLQLAYCSGNPAQHFTLNANNQIIYSGKCVDVAGSQTADGTRINLFTCTGFDNQNWSWR